MWVKICGIKNENDLRAALSAEPDAVGLVLDNECASILKIRELLRIGAVETILVIEEHDADKIISLWRAIPADTVQIANPAPELLQALRGSPFRILPSLHSSEQILQKAQRLLRWTDRVIIHTPWREERYHWGDLQNIFGAIEGSGILAGGLEPKNILGAINDSGAKGVDASSGLKDNLGAVSSRLCQEFVSRARLAEN